MSSGSPTVSVCMIAYNVAPFIAEAIEGVVKQQTGFPVELVIGEDCSLDETRAICEAYARRYPDLVRLLPSDINRGIAGNAARTLSHCRGKYIAICDADDVWVDPHKLQQQVDFLEAHPDYGVVYTDVQLIDRQGKLLEDHLHDSVRSRYDSGIVFFKLLECNFINNSTSLFRRSLLADHEIDPDRHYYTHDRHLWIHIASRAKVHFCEAKSTQYRRHGGNVTNTPAKKAYNHKKFLQYFYRVIVDYDHHYPWPVSEAERLFFFKKMLAYLRRGPGALKQKLHVLWLLHRHLPSSRKLARFIRPGRERRLVQ